jgi:hypothetical protein
VDEAVSRGRIFERPRQRPDLSVSTI